MRILVLLLAGMGVATGALAAEDVFPSRPLHIVVPAQAGGGGGAQAQIIADGLRKLWGQPVIIDYKPGANTIIGTDYVAKSKPDGYTLLVNSAAHTVNPVLYAKLPYDTLNDLVPMALLSTTPEALVVHPGTGVNSLEELVKAALADPGKWSFGYATSSSLLIEHWFNMLAKTHIEPVPYKGSGPMMNDLMGGQIQGSFAATSSLQAFIKSGRMKILGVLSKTPSAQFPDAPALAQGAFSDFTPEAWFGIFAVGGTPPRLLEKIGRDLQTVLHDPEVRRRFEAEGGLAGAEGPAVFAQRVKNEIALWRKVADAAGVKPE